MARLIVDTGFLVALYILRDALHESAIEFLRREAGTLITDSVIARQFTSTISPFRNTIPAKLRAPVAVQSN